MDIDIPRSERKRARVRKILLWSAGVAVVALLALVGIMLATPRVSRDQLVIGKAERGDVESAVAATGHLVPATEVIVSSPVASGIREIYSREGDEVEPGTPLLKLDLRSAEDEYRRIGDELAMSRNEMEQGRLNSETHLTDLEMKIRTKEMAADQLRAQADNERRLDSIGSGTGDRVRQAELAWHTACLELDQMRRQLANERRVEAAGERTRELRASITARTLREAERTLDDARISAPIRGTVTYINTSVGASVGAGERMAVISDLSHFRVEAEVSEGHSDRIAVGAPVRLRIGRITLTGRVSSLTAKSTSGIVRFYISLDDDSQPGLRPGLNVRADVGYDIKENVVRIPYGGFYSGPGEYDLFVSDGGSVMERRRVTLGDASSEWIEVKRGILPGEEVALSGTESWKHRKTIRLKQ
ncbi:MAG: efflux RND transporter periplasmic adaptor subunit [Muribaculaceae bacterium]|nr:efflux RND transporter periplasmic adaptor subunit [Muribaculaceae bacterium]